MKNKKGREAKPEEISEIRYRKKLLKGVVLEPSEGTAIGVIRMTNRLKTTLRKIETIADNQNAMTSNSQSVDKIVEAARKKLHGGLAMKEVGNSGILRVIGGKKQKKQLKRSVSDAADGARKSTLNTLLPTLF